MRFQYHTVLILFIRHKWIYDIKYYKCICYDDDIVNKSLLITSLLYYVAAKINKSTNEMINLNLALL